MTMEKIEWWVCRVVAEPRKDISPERALARVDGAVDDEQRLLWWSPEDGREPTLAEWRQMSHFVEIGTFGKAPNGEIVEFVETFLTEAAAQSHWERLRWTTDPKRVYRVIMTSAISDGEAS